MPGLCVGILEGPPPVGLGGNGSDPFRAGNATLEKGLDHSLGVNSVDAVAYGILGTDYFVCQGFYASRLPPPGLGQGHVVG